MSRWFEWLRFHGAWALICAERGWDPCEGRSEQYAEDFKRMLAEITIEQAEAEAFADAPNASEAARGAFRSMLAVGEA